MSASSGAPAPAPTAAATEHEGPPTGWSRLILVLLLLVFAVVLVRTAWISDDAYMTFRTISNFSQGYGLTWNPSERVQVYTHPLWMLVLLPFQLLFRDAFYTTAVISILLSLVAMFLFVTRLAAAFWGWFLGGIVLILSKAFVDYSSSGLENPLTHLLLVLFLWEYTRRDPTYRRLGLLALLAALAAMNRPDTLLIFLPPLAAAAYSLRGWKALRRIALGFLPLILWEIFSILYYGFPVPNPAYAKLNTGIALRDLIEQGLLYFLNSIDWDPITLTVVGAGLLAPLLTARRGDYPVAIGVVLYLLYVVWIGGDFMTGRYFAAPLLASVVLLAQAIRGAPPSRAAIATVVLAVLGLAGPRSPLMATSSYGQDVAPIVDDSGIADERAYYFSTSGLIQHERDLRLPYHPWIREGRAARLQGLEVVTRDTAGFFGYAAGPEVHVVDIYALGDALLARLPIDDPREWRIGHFVRSTPAGYLETLETGENEIQDPDVAEYYDHLVVLTRGPVWDLERLAEIFRFNTGAYDYLLERYFARQFQETVAPQSNGP